MPVFNPRQSRAPRAGRLACAAPLALALLLLAAPCRAQNTPKPGKAVTVTISLTQRRAQLQTALSQLRALETRSGGGKRNATPIFKSLDKAQIVRRADGATQSAKGNRWSALAAGAASDYEDVTALQKAQIRQLERAVQLEIDALDAWNTKTKGAYYQPVDADAIVAQLEKSGQIRVGPTWWQTQVAAFYKRIGDAWSNFWKWLTGLFPAPKAPPVAGAAPSMEWLVVVFWVMIVGVLGFLAFLAYRAFAGNLRWGRRPKKVGDDELEGEDAELLRLPPDELRDRAAAFAQAGNFREAVRHRFIALLLRLDGRGFWRYDARRTNWEHIAALRRAGAGEGGVVTPLADLTRRFDRVRYGGAQCSEGDWLRFDEDAANLEAQAGAGTGSSTDAREMAGAGR